MLVLALSPRYDQFGETFMHRLLPVFAFLGVIAVQPAVANQRCAATVDQATFEVQALRSHLMVLATGCSDGDRYNAFIRKYQRDLVANDQSVSAWFKRHYGAHGQQEHDRFVTDLANAVSSSGTVLGGDMCPRDGAMFTEVMALRGPADLALYAAAKDLIPQSIEVCAGQHTGATKPVSSKATKTAKH